MSDSVKQLAEQLLALKTGLFLMSPRDRIRALSTHETEDLIIELQAVADAALKSLESVKN